MYRDDDKNYNSKRHVKDDKSFCTYGRVYCCITVLIILGLVAALIALLVTFGAEGYAAYKGYKGIKAGFNAITADKLDTKTIAKTVWDAV